jgi:hypothetical protein
MNEIMLLIESITATGWVFLCALAGLTLAFLWIDRHREYDAEESRRSRSRHAA